MYRGVYHGITYFNLLYRISYTFLFCSDSVQRVNCEIRFKLNNPELACGGGGGAVVKIGYKNKQVILQRDVQGTQSVHEKLKTQ